MISKYVAVIEGNLDIFDEACSCHETTYDQARRDLFLDLVNDDQIPDRWSDFKMIMENLRPRGPNDKVSRSADDKAARFKEANSYRKEEDHG